MRKEVLLAAATLLAFTAPAAAACLDQLAQLEERLAALEADVADVQQEQPAAGAGQQAAAGETVELEMQGGQDVEVTAEQPGTSGPPQDTWLGGTPPSVQGAREQLEGARGMAEAGDEAGCLQQAAQAERIIADLEP